MKSAVEGSERTRERVLALLTARGTATTAELSAELSLTPAGVRRHLSALEEAGKITAIPPASHGTRRGRPARAYAPVHTKHAAETIALVAVQQLYLLGGQQAVEELAHTVAGVVQQRVRDTLVTVEGSSAHPRVRALAAALTSEGYDAEVSFTEGGALLCQHRCPVQDVAERFPQLCEAESHALGELLGQTVERHTTIARGDTACVTHIPVIPNAKEVEAS